MIWATRFYYFIVLLCVGLFSTWLFIQVSHDDLTQQPFDPHSPDAYATKITLTEFDDQGHIKDHLYADNAFHYINDVTKFTKPKAILYKTDDAEASNDVSVAGMMTMQAPSAQTPPWVISANNGKLYDNGNVLDLWGNVHVEQAKGKDNDATTLITSKLTYYPKSRTATTEEPVKIIQSNGNQIDAVGMDANLATGEITFLSDMRGRYQLQ